MLSEMFVNMYLIDWKFLFEVLDIRWPLFCHRQANAVEQSAWTALATAHHLRTIQTIVENVNVWLVGPQRPVSKR